MKRFVSTATLACAFALVLFAADARAELPRTEALLAELGFSAEQIDGIESGSTLASLAPDPSTARELTAGFAFFVPTPPAKLVEGLQQGLLEHVDPTTISSGTIASPATAAAFGSLSLAPDGAARAARYVAAEAGDDLNLSAGEIATFQALGRGAATAAVESALRDALLARVKAYQAQGLAGIEPYQRDGEKRDVSGELRSATAAMKSLAKYLPAFQRLSLKYPEGRPDGFQEAYRWSQFDAHGAATIALVHAMWVPDGDGFVVMQRQFYVSEGFNCEEAIAAFLPVRDGTVVVYSNRTSTDQVTGFGGSAKRSIGSKLLASQLESMFAKLQRKATR